MKIKFDPIALLYIFLVYVALATERQRVLPVDYMTKYYVGIVICILFFGLLIVRDQKIQLNKQVLYLSKILAIPTLVVFVYSIALVFFSPIHFDGYSSRLIGLTAYGILAIVQAVLVFQYFGRRAVGYTFTAICLSYLTSMAVAFNDGGLQPFISMLTDSEFNGSVLEMHELAPIAATFILYYLYLFFYKECRLSYALPRVLIGGLILLLSLKRIVLLSVFLVVPIFLFIYWFNRRQVTLGKEQNTLRLLRVLTVLFIVIIFFYVFAIKSGSIYTFIQKNNINTMSRNGLWIGIEPTYLFSLSFLGRGVGFVSKWMDNNWMTLNINGLSGTMGIHNDILKFYIELGFIGTFIYFYYYLYSVTKRIFKNIGRSQGILYFILMLFQMLVWFTDNISVYHNFLWTFYFLMFSLIGTGESDINFETRDLRSENNGI